MGRDFDQTDQNNQATVTGKDRGLPTSQPTSSLGLDLFYPETGDRWFVSLDTLKARLGQSVLVDYLIEIVIGVLPFRVNEKEKEYFKRHPIDGLRGVYAAVGALKRAGGGGGGNKRDALRHCYWAAQMFRDLSEEAAQEILDNHEFGTNDQQDHHNNKVGREIGLANKSANNDALWQACEAAAADGRLNYPGSPTPQPVTTPTPPPSTTTEPSSTGVHGGHAFGGANTNTGDTDRLRGGDGGGRVTGTIPPGGDN